MRRDTRPASPATASATHPLAGTADGRRRVVVVLHREQSCPGEIGHWLTAHGYVLDIRRPRFGDPLPVTLEGHAGAVIFGGPMSANDPDDYIRREIDWISVALRERKPFLGICLGAQLMARCLGARVAADPQEIVEVGYQPILPATGKDWPGHVYQWHREGFDIPRGAAMLATSGGAFPNQAIGYGPAAVGLQFHPEVTCAIMRRWTTQNREQLAGEQTFLDHVADHFRHGPAVRSWLHRFLARWIEGRAAVAA